MQGLFSFMASVCSPINLWAWQVCPEQSAGDGAAPGLFWAPPLHIHPLFPAQLCAQALPCCLQLRLLTIQQMSPLVLAAWGRCNLSNPAIEKIGNVTLSPIFITLWFLIPERLNDLLNVLMHQGVTNIWFYTISRVCWYPSLSVKEYFLLARQQCCWGPNFAFYSSVKPLGFYSR